MIIKFKKLDHELHFWAGVLIALFVFIPLTFVFSQWLAALVAFGITSIVGVGKEWYDKNIKKTKFEWVEAKWTAIGAAIPTILFIIADIIYYYSKP